MFEIATFSERAYIKAGSRQLMCVEKAYSCNKQVMEIPTAEEVILIIDEDDFAVIGDDELVPI